MNRAVQRVQLVRGYVLHQQPFRDSSLIVELFTREQGRFTVFAHGARGARGKRTRFAVLQPFRPLLLSWSGRGEAAQLSAAEEVAGGSCAVPAAQVMSAFYLNELLIKLLTRHDPHPELFDHYEAALARLAESSRTEVALRLFEARLLELIGYGLNLQVEADTGRAVEAQGQYHFQAGVHGFVVAEPGSAGAVSGQVLQGLRGDGELLGEAALRQARALMRSAIDECLEGRTLASRTVARSVHRLSRKEGLSG